MARKRNQVRFCPKCGKRLTKSTVEGYSYQCNSCDEDFYRIEVLTRKELKYYGRLQ